MCESYDQAARHDFDADVSSALTGWWLVLKSFLWLTGTTLAKFQGGVFEVSPQSVRRRSGLA